MTVLQRTDSPSAWSPRRTRETVSFLRTQAEALDAALRSADDCDALARALSTHAESHESWITLLATLTAGGECTVARELGNLYALCGRIAETLEREDCGRLGLPFDASLRRILADRLQARAAASVTALGS